MEPLDLAPIAQGGTLILNGAVALILYGIRRDLREHAETHRRHFYWIQKIRRKLWPDIFGRDNEAPHPDGQ